MTTDFLVEGSSNLTAYIAAHSSEDSAVLGSATFNDGVVIDRRVLSLGVNLSSRVPVDSYVFTIPIDTFSTSGQLKLTAQVGTSLGEVSDTITLLLFPKPALTLTVSTDSALKDALRIAKGSGLSHIKIQLGSGTYTFPPSSDSDFADWDLSTTNRLLTIEPTTGATPVVTDSTFYIKYAIWSGITFQTLQEGGRAVRVRNKARYVFDTCRFLGSTLTGTVGVDVDGGSDARLESCMMESLSHGVIGPSVVRDLFWRDLTGTVFRNVSRLLEGSVGYGLASGIVEEDTFWCVYDEDQWNPIIHHNIALDMQVPILSMHSSAVLDGCAIAGNVLNTHAYRGWFLTNVVNSYVVHNSVWTDPTDGSTIVVFGNRFSGNVVRNNYFTQLDTQLDVLSVGSVWDYNATEYKKNRGDHSLTNVDPGFANRFLLLTSSSSLLNRGYVEFGMKNAFGVLPYQNQIGAMPYHPDATMSSILSSTLTHATFGAAVSESSAGDFQAPSAGFRSGGGALIFSDGTQSGFLAVV